MTEPRLGSAINSTQLSAPKTNKTFTGRESVSVPAVAKLGLYNTGIVSSHASLLPSHGVIVVVERRNEVETEGSRA